MLKIFYFQNVVLILSHIVTTYKIIDSAYEIALEKLVIGRTVLIPPEVPNRAVYCEI